MGTLSSITGYFHDLDGSRDNEPVLFNALCSPAQFISFATSQEVPTCIAVLEGIAYRVEKQCSPEPEVLVFGIKTAEICVEGVSERKRADGGYNPRLKVQGE